jgi:hypothetical protein
MQTQVISDKTIDFPTSSYAGVIYVTRDTDKTLTHSINYRLNNAHGTMPQANKHHLVAYNCLD